MHVDFFIFLVIVNIFLLANCIVTRYQIFLKDKTKKKSEPRYEFGIIWKLFALLT
jgi:hypothetical protein